MKHLRSSLSDLRRLFEWTVTIHDIAEPLVSFDSDDDAGAVWRFMVPATSSKAVGGTLLTRLRPRNSCCRT
jgi:hypothetical protein